MKKFNLPDDGSETRVLLEMSAKQLALICKLLNDALPIFIDELVAGEFHLSFDDVEEFMDVLEEANSESGGVV